MKTFDLVFIPEDRKNLRSLTANVYVSSHGGHEDPIRKGKILISAECVTENEAHEAIDYLIANLQELKRKASKKFSAKSKNG